jgi:hypothetical protein
MSWIRIRKPCRENPYTRVVSDLNSGSEPPGVTGRKTSSTPTMTSCHTARSHTALPGPMLRGLCAGIVHLLRSCLSYHIGQAEASVIDVGKARCQVRERFLVPSSLPNHDHKYDVLPFFVPDNVHLGDVSLLILGSFYSLVDISNLLISWRLGFSSIPSSSRLFFAFQIPFVESPIFVSLVSFPRFLYLSHKNGRILP